jgi:hypothetical protein
MEGRDKNKRCNRKEQKEGVEMRMYLEKREKGV